MPEKSVQLNCMQFNCNQYIEEGMMSIYHFIIKVQNGSEVAP